jgi:hypothetical protein
MKSTIGGVMLFITYALFLFSAMVSGSILEFLGLIFIPIVMIPMMILSTLVTNFSLGLVVIMWIVLAFLLVGSDD